MKLTELDPRWLVKDGRRVGFVFKCPTKRDWYQSCMLENVPRREQWRMFNEVFRGCGIGEDEQQYTRVQGCRQDCVWRITSGGDFHDISVLPSIDGSAGGLWHGFITNGEIVGGV